MALRGEWKFSYKSGDVGAAAQKKEAHHKDRLIFWQDTQKNVMEEIKESGLEVLESQAVAYNSSMAAHGPQVMVRAEFQTKLNECHTKVVEHRKQAEQYASFREALLLNPNQTIELDVSDTQFFFGK